MNSYRTTVIKPFHSKLILFVLALVISLASEVPALLYSNTLDWDEDVIHYVAQRLLLHYELPFTTTFENKPPFNYVFYIPALLIDPTSKVALRIVMSLMMGLSIFLIAATFFKDYSFGRHFFLYIVFFIFLRALPGGFTWLSEMNSIFWIAIWLWIGNRIIHNLAVDKNQNIEFFLVGCISSLTILTRTNLVFLVAAALFFFLIHIKREKGKYSSTFAKLVLSGICAALLLVFLPYIISRDMSLLIDGLFRLPLAVSDGVGNIQFGLKRISIYLGTLLLLINILLFYKRNNSGCSFDFFKYCTVLYLSVLFGVVLNTPNFGHHLLQLVPFISVGVVISSVLLKRSHLRSTHRASLTIITIGLISISALFYKTPRPSSEATRYQNEVIKTLKELGLERYETVYAPTYPYVYSSFLSSPLHAYFVHPANLNSVEILTLWRGGPYDSKNAIEDLLKTEPRWLVFQVDSWDEMVFKEMTIFDSYLKQNTGSLWQISVWKKKSDSVSNND